MGVANRSPDAPAQGSGLGIFLKQGHVWAGERTLGDRIAGALAHPSSHSRGLADDVMVPVVGALYLMFAEC